VAAGEQGHHHPLEHRVLPDDHALDLEERVLERLPRFVVHLTLAHGRQATEAKVTGG
jgi:hypothetical protein